LACRARAQADESRDRQRRLLNAEITRLAEARIRAAAACRTAADNFIEAVQALQTATADLRIAVAKTNMPMPVSISAFTLKGRIAQRIGEALTQIFGGHEFGILKWKNNGGAARDWEAVEREASRADILRLIHTGSLTNGIYANGPREEA
jgi:hypothetical protein